MKRFFKTDITAKPCSSNILLRSVVNDLLGDLKQSTKRNEIVVENEVPTNLCLTVAQNEVLRVIKDLLNTVVFNARNTYLLISADKYADIVTLRIQDRNNYNGYAMSFSLMSVERQARSIGGEIVIKGAQERVATVSFSFPDMPQIRAWSYQTFA